MVNVLSYIRHNHRNWYSLIVSTLLAAWYSGIYGLINHYLPDRHPIASLFLMIIPIIIFLSDDGKLDELYVPRETNISAINGAVYDNIMVKEDYVNENMEGYKL